MPPTNMFTRLQNRGEWAFLVTSKAHPEKEAGLVRNWLGASGKPKGGGMSCTHLTWVGTWSREMWLDYGWPVGVPCQALFFKLIFSFWGLVTRVTVLVHF